MPNRSIATGYRILAVAWARDGGNVVVSTLLRDAPIVPPRASSEPRRDEPPLAVVAPAAHTAAAHGAFGAAAGAEAAACLLYTSDAADE